MLGLSPWEIAVIVLVVVLLFGTRRLPELGSGLGKAISNFRKSFREGGEIDVTPKEPAETQGSGKEKEEDKRPLE